MRNLALAATAIAILIPARSSAQLPGNPPSFEVMSIRPASPNPALGRGIFTFPGGRVLANGCNLLKLIQEAFNVQAYQVAGGPNWTTSARYDIEAKPPQSSKSGQAKPPYPKAPLNDEQRLMLQSLLRERFQLKTHSEVKEARVYMLIRTNRELKMQSAKDTNEFPWVGGLRGGVIVGDGIAGANASMEELARRLGPYFDHPVLDRTGVKGAFDFRYEYNPGDTQPDVLGSITSSLQALGLKLEPGTGPVETIVIESAEKPTEN